MFRGDLEKWRKNVKVQAEKMAAGGIGRNRWADLALATFLGI